MSGITEKYIRFDILGGEVIKCTRCKRFVDVSDNKVYLVINDKGPQTFVENVYCLDCKQKGE
jgi:hypothetical protein